MKERDYVRIKNEAGWCCIGNIVKINEFREPAMKCCKYCIDIQGEDYIYVSEDIIAKSSPNIIDLIEAGDYVNGMQVARICFDEDGQRILNLSNCILELMNDDIKSIVTKEQFSQMEYKVGE